MPQCKMSNCREPALPTGKRYCAHHKAEYLRKQREYDAVRVTLRCCCDLCGQHLSKSRHDAGANICGECEDQRNFNHAANRKAAAFNEATTVEELKDWMREYLL